MHAPPMSQLEALAMRADLRAWVMRRARCCEAVAKDLIQDACVVACEHGNFSAGYFFGIVRNKVREHVRKSKRVIGLCPKHEDLVKDPWIEAELEQRDSILRDRLHLELNRFTDDERDCLYKAYADELDQATLAAAKGLSHAAVRQRLLRMRKRLRDLLLPLIVTGISAFLTLMGLYEAIKSSDGVPSEVTPTSSPLSSPDILPDDTSWIDGLVIPEGEARDDAAHETLHQADGMNSGANPHRPPLTVCAGEICTVRRKALRRWVRTELENPEFRSVPVRKAGRFVGMQMASIPRGSFYEWLGLKSGDVITHVNGRALGDPLSGIPDKSKQSSCPVGKDLAELREKFRSLTDQEIDSCLNVGFRVSPHTGAPIPRIAITFRRHGHEFRKVIWIR